MFLGGGAVKKVEKKEKPAKAPAAKKVQEVEEPEEMDAPEMAPIIETNHELLLPGSRSPLDNNSREFCSAFLSRSGFSGSMPISNPSMDDQIATDLRNIHIVRRRKIQILTNKSEY